MGKWIKVSDRLPEKKDQYLCYIKGFEDSESCDGWYNEISISYFGFKTKEIREEANRIIYILEDKMSFDINRDGYTSKEVTHWQALPEAPKEE